MGTGILTLSALCAIAFIIILHKCGIRNFTKHSIVTDVFISGLLTILFFGTFSGMVTALIAGIFVSLYLVFAKYVWGTKRVNKS